MITEKEGLEAYRHNWNGKTRLQVVEEFASFAQETKRIPDAYFFEADGDGDLYSPSAKCKVKNAIVVDNPVGELEGEAFNKINTWFKGSGEGATLWISPPHHDCYFTSKIIISEIRKQDGKKILLNRAVILDWSDQECFQLAKDLAAVSLNRPLLASIEEVRANPLVFRSSWQYILEEFIDLPGVWKMIRNGTDLQTKEKALMESEAVYSSLVEGKVSGEQMRDQGVIGPADSSCPTIMGRRTAFGTFLGHSTVLEGCTKISCKRCSWEAKDEDVRKIQNNELTCCPHCGWRPGEPV